MLTTAEAALGSTVFVLRALATLQRPESRPLAAALHSAGRRADTAEAMLDIRELLLGEPRDFELCVSHIEALYAELFGPSGVPTLHDVQQLREQLSSRGPLHWAFLARDADAVAVGFITLAESFAIFARGRYGIINELWVHPEARSQGVGAALLEHCKAFGRARGWRRIDVTAPPGPEWDRSFDFYRKHGFTPTGRKLKTLLG